MEEKQATQASHSVGVARTLLDLALDYYEGVANVGIEDNQSLAREECDARIASVRAWVNAIEAGIASSADDEEEEECPGCNQPVSQCGGVYIDCVGGPV